jgi:hypothetical protein
MRQNQRIIRLMLAILCLLTTFATDLSDRGASLKSRTCFFGISSILLYGVHRGVCGYMAATGRCWYG